MQIVIIGAGHMGLHLASVLSRKDHNVILIDKDPQKIEEASKALDITARLGTGTDWRLLAELQEFSPDMILAMTQNDETNLAICCIAKHLGYPQTVARISQSHFVNCARLDIASLFHADYLIAPDLLVATEIYKLMTAEHTSCIENFAHGAVQMRTFKIPSNWNKIDLPLRSLGLPDDVRLGFIHRPLSKGSAYIFPHGNDIILPEDEVTVIGKRETIQRIHSFFGLRQKQIRSVVIVGGSYVGFHLASLLLKEGIFVKIINKDLKQCQLLAAALPKALVLHHDAGDLDFLLEEKVETCDCFVTCTRNEETNLLVGKLALKAGAKSVIACISSPAYTAIAEDIGIEQTVMHHKSFENHILALISAQKTSSIVQLYENEAEVLEIKVSPSSKLIGLPILELAHSLPKDFLFAAIQHKGSIAIATGPSVLASGDTVITFTHPRHVSLLQRLF